MLQSHFEIIGRYNQSSCLLIFYTTNIVYYGSTNKISCLHLTFYLESFSIRYHINIPSTICTQIQFKRRTGRLHSKPCWNVSMSLNLQRKKANFCFIGLLITYLLFDLTKAQILWLFLELVLNFSSYHSKGEQDTSLYILRWYMVQWVVVLWVCEGICDDCNETEKYV